MTKEDIKITEGGAALFRDPNYKTPDSELTQFKLVNMKDKKKKVKSRTFIHVKVDEPTSLGTYSIKNKTISKMIEKLVDLDYYFRTGRNRKKFEKELMESREMFKKLGEHAKQEGAIEVDKETQEEFTKTLEVIRQFHEEKDKLEAIVESEKEVKDEK